MADYFDDQVDQGRRPEEFARVWLHTHPGNSAQPSGIDEATFARVFGGADWAVMFILARGGQTYARLRFNVGPGGEISIPVEVDYSRPFAGSDEEVWTVNSSSMSVFRRPSPSRSNRPGCRWRECWRRRRPTVATGSSRQWNGTTTGSSTPTTSA